MDSFYIGHLKGVDRVYQLTAVDVFTRWATVAIIVGTATGALTASFIDQLVRHWRRHGYPLRAVITDNGPEYIAHDFLAALTAKTIRHVRIPARSPNHNAVVERFHGTILQTLAPGLPPPPIHQPPPAASRSRRLVDHLQPPPPQPQRLHARPHTPSNPHQLPHPTGIMTTSHRAHLSPRPPDRKI